MANDFIVNKRKKRIHYARNTWKQCNVKNIAEKDRADVDRSVAVNLLNDQFRPCWWCTGTTDGKKLGL